MRMWVTYRWVEMGELSDAEDRIAEMTHHQLKKAMHDSLILRDMVRVELAKRVRESR